jgi:hypothetical protein
VKTKIHHGKGDKEETKVKVPWWKGEREEGGMMRGILLQPLNMGIELADHFGAGDQLLSY